VRIDRCFQSRFSRVDWRLTNETVCEQLERSRGDEVVEVAAPKRISFLDEVFLGTSCRAEPLEGGRL
jgi:hypothetical protein